MKNRVNLPRNYERNPTGTLAGSQKRARGYRCLNPARQTTSKNSDQLCQMWKLRKTYQNGKILLTTAMGYSEEHAGKMAFKKFKEHLKKLTKMEEVRPLLYGLIMKYMSVESRDEVAQDQEFETWHAEKDPEKLWQVIIRTHKVNCVSNIDPIKELAARRSYQNIKQGSFEMLAQCSECFRDTYQGYKATGMEELPVNIPEKEQALGFLHGLDQGRHAAFKSSMLSRWAPSTLLRPPMICTELQAIGSNHLKARR
jgi:hypothetical protein